MGRSELYCTFQLRLPPLREWFLAHRIRISEILPWDRKSFLTHAILPRLSRGGYIHWLYWNSRTLSSSDVIVMLEMTSSCEKYLSVFTNTKNSDKQETDSIIRVRVGQKNMSFWITVCHHSASLVMPNGLPRDRFFYHILTLMIHSYIIWRKHPIISRHGAPCIIYTE